MIPATGYMTFLTWVSLTSITVTKPLESCRPLKHGLILPFREEKGNTPNLRRDGYLCVFAADYYGASYKDVGNDGNEHEINMPSHKWMIDNFLEARRDYAWGEQYDYFDHPDCVGWTRTGNDENPLGMAVLLSNGEDGKKHMETGSPESTYRDITEHISEQVTTNKEGWGEFLCKGGSVSVWVPVDR